MQSRKRLFVQSVRLPPLVLALFTRMRLRCAHIHVVLYATSLSKNTVKTEKLIERMYCLIIVGFTALLDLNFYMLILFVFRFCH